MELIKAKLNSATSFRPLEIGSLVETPAGHEGEVVKLSNNEARLATILFADGSKAQYHYDDLTILV